MNKPLDLKELMVDQAELAKRLRQETSGEVMTDSASRGRYATDASIYQAMPVAVFVPKTAQDIASAIQIAAELGVPVLPRGGGTSQCGQTTGAALVIDNTKYFRNVLDLNLDKGYVEVEPGIVLDHLNGSLKQHGLWYPVDVSTAGQATIGGMAGNNSCGSRSIAYGNMVHNVLGIDAWLADGQVAQFGNYANSSGAAKQLGDFVNKIRNAKTKADIDAGSAHGIGRGAMAAEHTHGIGRRLDRGLSRGPAMGRGHGWGAFADPGAVAQLLGGALCGGSHGHGELLVARAGARAHRAPRSRRASSATTRARTSCSSVYSRAPSWS